MQFNSLIFLSLFLPLALAFTFIAGKKKRNGILLLVSLIFYAWGGVSYSIILIGSIILNYFAGLLLSGKTENRKRKTIFIITIMLNILILVIFKYLDFLFQNINILLDIVGSPPVAVSKIILPLGISFYTFCCISYIVDIYRGDSDAEKNFINFALYISFFPKILAGPIVRYNEINKQFSDRKATLKIFSNGIERFIIGLGKKVLIADIFAVIADHVFSMPADSLTFYQAWAGIIAYSLQIYFDFSAYSDMAIGIGKMVGFTFAENFNFPYIAKSLQEFWQRWHISLSTWLRDYLFIPLSLKFRNIGNAGVSLSLLITFTLCGLWHGSGWSFAAWGLLHGFFLMIESMGLGKLLKKLWRPFRHLYVIIIILFSWVFFRSGSLSYAVDYCSAMLHFSFSPSEFVTVRNYFDNASIVCMLLAIAGSSGFFSYINIISGKLFSRFSPATKGYTEIALTVTEMAGLLLVLIISSSVMASGSYNPFIYFRF